VSDDTMAAVATQSSFMSALLGERQAGTAGPLWLERLRGAALERANRVPLPTTRDEEWRFTDLAPLTRLSFQPVSSPAAVSHEDIGGCELPEAQSRIVFVDGHHVPALSRPASGGGLQVLDLAEALMRHPALIEQHLGRIAGEASTFDALNTAFLKQAAVIVIAADHEAAAPVHILHVATRREHPHALYPRALVVAAPHARASIVEDFCALGEAAYFSAAVTELYLDAGAALTHVRLQREAFDAFQLGSCTVKQAAASSYRMTHVALGGRLSRLELNVVHDGPGCETAIDGLALIGKRQLADTHSFVDHAHPDGALRQQHKCVVAGGAHAVFNGKILVREGAQRTDAGQSFRGLLLSERAHIDAKPQLEIFADDVKCAHGAAIGQLDPEEMFYLQSRGLAPLRARNLLTYAFAAEVIERVPVPSLRARLERTVLERTQEAA
jgi:Fe-S cluster assembly protein SufD